MVILFDNINSSMIDCIIVRSDFVMSVCRKSMSIYSHNTCLFSGLFNDCIFMCEYFLKFRKSLYDYIFGASTFMIRMNISSRNVRPIFPSNKSLSTIYICYQSHERSCMMSSPSSILCKFNHLIVILLIVCNCLITH